MKGFVKNEGSKGTFTLQRRLHPGATLTFDDAYLAVGAKSGKKEGPAFVKWLRETFFTEGQWAFYKEDGVPYFTAETEKALETKPVKAPAPAKGAGRVMKRKTDVSEKGSVITANTLIESDFPEAQALIEKCTNKAVLKKALALSRHFSKKDEHMRHLMKRLEQVY